MTTIAYLKGHGAGNDFIIVPDVEGAVELTAEWVQRVCNRHTGLGADGVLRVVAEDDHYFMDYRNADGTLAETCGNGIRVFARYLVETGLERRGTFTVSTRAGSVAVTVRADDATFDDIAVDMGLPQGESAPTTHVETDGGHFTGTPMWMPNPHCVSVVATLADAGHLMSAPQADPAATFPHGANFEFIEQRGRAHVGMRTYERGVGETLACGSGACAAAQVWAQRMDLPAQWTVQVDVLGGTLYVDCDARGSLTLRGPARIVAQGTTWL